MKHHDDVVINMNAKQNPIIKQLLLWIGLLYLQNYSQVINAFSMAKHAQPIVSKHTHKAASLWKKESSLCLQPQQQRQQQHTSCVSFESPLLENGYPPAVAEYQSQTLGHKPLLLYLPGFDGTLLAPFLQFPELHTEFDVKGMVVDMDDRSTIEDLKRLLLEFILDQVKIELDGQSTHRPVFIMGESFGGILALEVALAIQDLNKHILKKGDKDDDVCANQTIHLQGIVLINPATCYHESNLAKYGPPVTKVSSWLYPLEVFKLLPLFTDEYAIPQLSLILQAKALPSVIDDEQKEAYLGRTAFSIPNKLKFMPQDTLRWRLEEWLSRGCTMIQMKEKMLQNINFPVLIVAGEADNTLPSVQEAMRLSSLLGESITRIHIVQGAGHACTSGSRVDLTALMRDVFRDRLMTNGRREMKHHAFRNTGEYFGMEERYDRAKIGLNPIKYWSRENYASFS